MAKVRSEVIAGRLQMPMTDKQLAGRDAKRNLGAELLQSVREMKAGKGKVAARVEPLTGSYFMSDTKNHQIGGEGKPVFNRVTGMKDSFSK
jgi:hypothetical protein